MKRFISGLVIGIVLSAAVTSFAATALKEAYFNDIVKLNVDGKSVTTDVLSATIQGQAYGKNYVSARDLAEAMGGMVFWNQETKTISVTTNKVSASTPTTSYSYSKPAPIGTMQTLSRADILQTYTVETKVTQTVRGTEAWSMVEAANMFNEPAPEGYEYLLAKIYLKVNNIDAGQQFNLYEQSYTLVSSTGKDYDSSFVVSPSPSIDAELYEGASNEGWVVFIVKTDDTTPKIAFERDYDGSGGLWFKAY